MPRAALWNASGRMLPPLEIVCLRWISKGKSLQDIALLEGIEKSDVEMHLARAVSTLEVSSIEEANAKIARS